MENSLQVIEQKSVTFYEDEIVAVRVKDGTIYVPVKPVCERMGVTWPSQSNRIKRDAVLDEAAQNISVFVTNTQGSQHREMLCLPLEYISGFLFGINASRVKDEIRERLIRYQKECHRVLSEAFFEGRLSADSDFEALLQNADNPAVQAYQTFQALAKLARHQLILESRVNDNTERIEQLESIIGDTKRHVTPSQAAQVSQAVKAIAMDLQNKSGRNEYGGVYGELYRRFEITSYKQLPQNRFDEAMNFLTGWYTQLTGDADVPF